MENKFIQELIRDVPSQKILVQMAWPSLTAETKLLIILEDQKKHDLTSDWLHDLAINDSSEIVRFFGTLKAQIQTHPNFKGEPPSEDDLIRSERIKKDDSMDVKLAHTMHTELHYDIDLFAKSPKNRFLCLSQREKLLFIRTSFGFDFDKIVALFELIFTSNLQDTDVYELSLEVIGHSLFANNLKDKDWPDGQMAHWAGNDLKKAWQLLATTYRRHSSEKLAETLPFFRGLADIEVDFLASLNENIIRALLIRSINDESYQLKGLIEKIQNSPELYPSTLNEFLGHILCELQKKHKEK